jgi:hypothetical protein
MRKEKGTVSRWLQVVQALSTLATDAGVPEIKVSGDCSEIDRFAMRLRAFREQEIELERKLSA